jgi:hypothetical protein
MRKLTVVIFAILCFAVSYASDFNVIKPKIDLSHEFIVKETENYSIELIKELPLRFSNILVKPKKTYKFSMMLYFICDTPDLSEFDTPEKMETKFRKSSRKYLPYSKENEMNITPLNWNGRYGFKTVFTDKNYDELSKVPDGEFRYITRGMVRISNNTALGFSIMSNDLNSTNYEDLLKYVKGFVINPLEEKYQ